MSGFPIDLASTRLAFFLLAVLAVMIVLSAVIPQRGVAEDQVVAWQSALGERYAIIERLRLDRIYFSPAFFVVLGLLAVNLVAGNIRRFRTVLRVERTLLKTRHIGSIVFHLSLLVIIVGVVLHHLFKFQGTFGLTEGQTARDERGQYLRTVSGPLYREPFGRFEISLEKVHEIYEIEEASTAAARIRVSASSGSPGEAETILINHPFVWSGLEFHFGPKIGYSPELLVTDAAGNRLFRGFVRLANRVIEGREVHEDFVWLPGGAVRVRLAVRPDGPTAAPVRHATVERESEVLFRGALAPGDTASVEDLRVSIPRLRRWCYVDVVKNPFLDLVFAGFWSALAGLGISALARVSPRERRPA